MSAQVNSTETIGYLVLIVWALIVGGLLLIFVLQCITKLKVRWNDNRIFKVAEEARNDFS